jgi:hypothetical protein
LEVRPPPVWTRLPRRPVPRGSFCATAHAVPTRITVAVGLPAARRASATKTQASVASRSNFPAAPATAAIPPRKNAATAFVSPPRSAVPVRPTVTPARPASRALVSQSFAVHARPASAVNAFLPVKAKRPVALLRAPHPTVPNAVARRTVRSAGNAKASPASRRASSATTNAAIWRTTAAAAPHVARQANAIRRLAFAASQRSLPAAPATTPAATSPLKSAAMASASARHFAAHVSPIVQRA